jgi:dehydratase
MKSSLIRRVGTTLGTATVALATVLLAAAPASAAEQTIPYDCQATTGFGNTPATFDRTVDATAPETVAVGDQFAVSIITAPATVPTTASGLPVNHVRSFRASYPIPAHTTLVSATLSGGDGLNGEPTVSVVGSNVVVTLDSTIAAGATYTMPTLTLNLQAAEAGTVEVKLGGTSYADPGLFFIAQINFLGSGLDAWTSCFPSPNPVLATTTITAAA